MVRLSRPPGFILAGGKSSRMGANKALLPLGRDTVLGHVLRRVEPQVSALAINATAPYEQFGLPVIEDDPGGQLGPLAGILTGMRHYAETGADDVTHFLTTPCDSPFLPLDLTERLAAAAPDAQTIVIAASLGRHHPVFALWPVALAASLQRWLVEEDNRRIMAFIAHHRSVTVDFPIIETDHGTLDPFLNLNTQEDLVRAAGFAEVLA